MDFTPRADIDIIDGHIHPGHTRWARDVIRFMDAVPLSRANCVSTPRPPQIINQNPALIYLKAHYPERFYLSGGLDLVQVAADRGRMSELLAAQVRTLRAIGCDGLKLIEGKPTARKRLDMNLPLDAPGYAGMWAVLAELDMPAVYHVADPEEFWDLDRMPDRARRRGWFYGDGTFPTKESLYAEVDRILARHPALKIIFAHFYFLSADLERAGRFLDAHPNVCFDLTPGSEMYNNFTRNHQATRAFFIRYQDRIVYGTDTHSGALERNGIADPLGRARAVRTFLESDTVFVPSPLLPHWLGAGLDGWRGIALPRRVLEKIYHANFERLYGIAPRPLNREAAIAELERMAGVIDANAGGEEIENQAREVAAALRAGS